MIHDAHFADLESAVAFEDWGHSSWEQATWVAQQANVGGLALFHFAPELTDDTVDEIAMSARGIFTHTIAAREGLIIDLPLF